MFRFPFIERHPVWFVVFVEIAMVFVTVLVGTVSALLGLTNQAAYGVSNVILVVLAVLLTTGLGWWKAIGFRAFQKRSDAWFYLVALVPLIAVLLPGVKLINPHHVIVVFFTALSVGIAEEIIFRGIMLNTLKKVGPWFAIITTTLLCGSIHGVDALTSRNPYDAVGMVINGLAVGVLFSSLVIKKGVLWPLVIAHFLSDFFFLLRDPAGLIHPAYLLVITSLFSLLSIAFGVWLMTHPAKTVVLAHESAG